MELTKEKQSIIANIDLNDEDKTILETFIESGLADNNIYSELKKANEGTAIIKTRLWEAILYKYLVSKFDPDLISSKDSGPDFIIKVPGHPTINIEAIAPKFAKLASREKNFEACLVDTDVYVKSWSGGISTKNTEICKYINECSINDSKECVISRKCESITKINKEINIIAIANTQSKEPTSFYNNPNKRSFPRILEYLGNITTTLISTSPYGMEYATRECFKKKGGNGNVDIKVGAFLKGYSGKNCESLKNISGVIAYDYYSKDFLLIANENALVPIPDGLF